MHTCYGKPPMPANRPASFDTASRKNGPEPTLHVRF